MPPEEEVRPEPRVAVLEEAPVCFCLCVIVGWVDSMGGGSSRVVGVGSVACGWSCGWVWCTHQSILTSHSHVSTVVSV